jgi:hypothetical protein
MITGARNLVGALMLGTAVLVSPAASALAAPAAAPEAQLQNGLVNVAIEDLVNIGNVQVLNGVSVAVAANLVAQVCNISANAAILAVQAVDQGGQRFSCESATQRITVTQDSGNRGGNRGNQGGR